MTGGSWEGGSTRRWRKLRAAVLERDRYRCQIRLEGTCIGRATHAHHLDGKAKGDNPDRIVAACAPCNLKTGDPTKTKQPDPQPQPRTRW